ncbi:uncharacterized protein [Equus caballus]|uniref:uncharacterized protein isoform X2 n=1 Tax=Equus caballus TaxID=9796 RepID=UPI0038B376D2
MTQGRNGRSLARGQVASQVGTSRPGPPPRAAAAWDQVSLCRATLPGVSPGYQDAFRISTFRPNTEKGPWVRKGILRRISFRGGRDFTGLFQSEKDGRGCPQRESQHMSLPLVCTLMEICFKTPSGCLKPWIILSPMRTFNFSRTGSTLWLLFGISKCQHHYVL